MRVGKSLLLHACFVALTWQPPVHGADLSAAQLRDGLGRLAALLAAEVPQNARWVLVSSERGRFGIFDRQEDVFSTEGNAFLWDEKPGREARIMTLYDGGVYPVKAETGDSSQDAQYLRREFRATWKNADAAKDAAAAVAWLKKEAQKSAGAVMTNSGGRFSGDPDDAAAKYAASQQTALLWAALLLHTGQDAPALSLATTVLAGTDEARRKQLLDAFFDRLGNQAYAKVMQDFDKQRDWARLRDALDALVKKFSSGWAQRDAVRVFHHHVVERAKLPAAPPLKTQSPLVDDAQTALLAWLKELEAGKQPPYDIWTLPPPPAGEDGENEPRANEAETAFPRSHGLAAVPLLAALLADDTLTLVGLNQHGNFQRHYFGGGGRDEAERLRGSYRSLQKPPTRADLAWSALQRVLPQDLQHGEREDLAEAIPDILAWHASVKNTTPADLALAYLESGQNDAAVLAHAVATDDPKKLARLEGSMLESVDIWDLNRLEPFIEKLGPERGPPFLVKVRQKLEGDLGRYQSDAAQQERQRKQMEAALKRLEATAKGEKKTLDLAALLAVLAAYDPMAENDDRFMLEEAYRQIPKVMQKLAAPARVEAIAKTLPGFKSAQFAGQMLEFAFDGDGEKMPALKPEEHQAVLTATRPYWQQILEVEPTDENLRLQTQVVIRLQTLAGIKSDFPLFDLTQLGERGIQILRARGLAILAGQQPAALPDPKAINDDERAQLLAEWGAKSPADIAAGLRTLEIDRLIALNDTLQREVNQRGNELPAGLQTHINSVHEIKAKDTDAAPWQAWKGRLFNKEALLALAREISATKATGMLTVSLHRSSPLFGFTLHVSESKTISGWQSHYLTDLGSEAEMIPPDARRFSMAVWQQRRGSEEWGWFDAPTFHEPKAAAEPKNEAEEALQELAGEARETWQKVSAALDKPQSDQLTFHLFTVPVSLLKTAE